MPLQSGTKSCGYWKERTKRSWTSESVVSGQTIMLIVIVFFFLGCKISCVVWKQDYSSHRQGGPRTCQIPNNLINPLLGSGGEGIKEGEVEDLKRGVRGLRGFLLDGEQGLLRFLLYLNLLILFSINNIPFNYHIRHDSYLYLVYLSSIDTINYTIVFFFHSFLAEPFQKPCLFFTQGLWQEEPGCFQVHTAMTRLGGRQEMVVSVEASVGSQLGTGILEAVCSGSTLGWSKSGSMDGLEGPEGTRRNMLILLYNFHMHMNGVMKWLGFTSCLLYRSIKSCSSNQESHSQDAEERVQYPSKGYQTHSSINQINRFGASNQFRRRTIKIKTSTGIRDDFYCLWQMIIISSVTQKRDVSQKGDSLYILFLTLWQLFLGEDPVYWWFIFKVGYRNDLERGLNTLRFILCENFHLYRKKRESFGLVFLYLNTGRIVGELGMNICIFLAPAVGKRGNNGLWSFLEENQVYYTISMADKVHNICIDIFNFLFLSEMKYTPYHEKDISFFINFSFILRFFMINLVILRFLFYLFYFIFTDWIGFAFVSSREIEGRAAVVGRRSLGDYGGLRWHQRRVLPCCRGKLDLAAKLRGVQGLGSGGLEVGGGHRGN
ncbi:hypothetical protein VP01_1946g3 [Puccinia sorghi]|uniref:Uncharacterized protein n=1 Tax=Puccinia sorghi TaxID=27349 RepID=A0A0L6VCC4_9BASI|nr:hypothetical protein VP01_1946g3 [Puccinia sorghi]